MSFAQGASRIEGDGSADHKDDAIPNSLAVAALRRFGLDAYIAKCCEDGPAPPTQSPAKANIAPEQKKEEVEDKDKKSKKGFKKKTKEEKVAEASSVPISPVWEEKVAVHYKNCLDSNGHIDFNYVFNDKNEEISDNSRKSHGSNIPLRLKSALERASGRLPRPLMIQLHDTQH